MKADIPRGGSEERLIRTSRALTFSSISSEGRDRGKSETNPKQAKALLGLAGCAGKKQ